MTSTQDKPVPVAVDNPENIGDLPRVPEYLLKKRKINQEHRAKLQTKTKLQIAKAVRGRRQPKAVNVSIFDKIRIKSEYFGVVLRKYVNAHEFRYQIVTK